MDSPWVVALGVFVAIYVTFLLIRLLADMYIVGVALASAVLAFNIYAYYPDFKMELEQLKFLNTLGIELSAQPDGWSVLVIAILITLMAVLLCIPVLPFSATYRQILGVERLNRAEETKIRNWVREELEQEHTREDKDESA